MSFLQDLILSYSISNKITHSGFHSIKCPVCSDYKERAGFKFNEDGIGYNCFNCGVKFKYKYGTYCNDNMSHILSYFGITLEEIIKAIGKDKLYHTTTSSSDIKNTLVIDEVSLPENSFKISELYEFRNDYENVKKVIDYLENRKINVFDYDFYYSFNMMDYVIIPYYYGNKIVYWNARSCNSKKIKYIKVDKPNNGIIFNKKNLFNGSGIVLITEGELNSISLGTGVALGGSKINDNMFKILDSTTRNKVFIMDNDSSINSYNIANIMVDHGYGITYLDSFKDANESVQHLGRLATLQQLRSNIQYGLTAKCLINIQKVKNGCN